jgi:hypothetical protein
MPEFPISDESDPVIVGLTKKMHESTVDQNDTRQSENLAKGSLTIEGHGWNLHPDNIPGEETNMRDVTMKACVMGLEGNIVMAVGTLGIICTWAAPPPSNQ